MYASAWNPIISELIRSNSNPIPIYCFAVSELVVDDTNTKEQDFRYWRPYHTVQFFLQLFYTW